MDKSTGRTVRLGILVTLSVALFTIAVYLIGQKQSMFSETFYVSVMFNNVNGLQPGNNVRYSGITIGSVTSVTILNDSSIEVGMRIQEKVRTFIKKDAVASIGTDGLMGNMLVNISPGRKETSASVQDGDTLKAYSRIKTDDILTTLNVTNENAAVLTVELLAIIHQIRNGKGAIGTLLYDTLLRTELKQSMFNLREATQNTNRMITHLNAVLTTAERGPGMTAWLLNDTLVQGQVRGLLDQLNHTNNKLQHTTDSINAILYDVRAGQGTIPQLLNDTSMVNDLRKILHNLKDGTAKFDQDMEALQHNFLTRKFFKKKEKASKP